MTRRRKVWPVGTGDLWSGWPITTGYGIPGSMWAAGRHTGVDYAAPTGKPVRSIQRGLVVETGITSWGAAYGDRAVIISGPRLLRWGGRRVLYAHLDSNTVRVGQRVRKGQIIGRVGARGNVTGPHLHLEVRKKPWRYNVDTLDPRRWAGG